MTGSIERCPRATGATLALLATVLCATADASEVVRLSEPVEQTAEFETFGSPLDDTASSVSLEAIVNDGDSWVGKKVRVVVSVAEVCQKKGCFFIARQGDEVVRVSFKDYGFFVPTDIGGRRVTLIGEVVAREISPEQAAHYADDLGSPAAAVRPGKAYEIVATSVRVPRG